MSKEMSKPPTISIAQSTPLTPKAAKEKDEPSHSSFHTRNNSLSFKTNLTPSYSFGMGFSPSFQFYSPRNVNLLTSLSPQRFFQVSNTNSVKVAKTEKNVFNSNTPSRLPNNKFLNSLSSVQVVQQDGPGVDGQENDDKESNTSDSHSQDQEESLWSSIHEQDTNNLTALTVSLDQTPKRSPEPQEHENNGNVSGNPEFLTPRRLFLNKSQGHSGHSLNGAISDIASKKRRLSIDESPNSSIASRLESMASPPRSLKSIPRRRSSQSFKTGDDKVWTGDLDDILVSSYLKFKEFRKNSIACESSILKNSSQNKVLSRMLLNRSGILRTPKQIASRLFRLTKQLADKKKSSSVSLSQLGERTTPRILDESPSLTEEIDEIIRTPLEDLIGTASHLDSINSAEINAQIDKELDLIFSPAELQASPFPMDSSMFATINEFQISYNPSSNSGSGVHYFINNSLKTTRPFNLSVQSVTKKLHLANGLAEQNDQTIKSLCPQIIDLFAANNLLVYEVSNSLNLNMVRNNNYDSLDSVIMNSNPFDLEKGFVNSFMKISINEAGSAGSGSDTTNWKCFTRIFNGESLLLSCNDPVMCYGSENGVNLVLPFLKNFWTGFLSLLINGNNDKTLLKNLSITQIIYEGAGEAAKIQMCVVHRFDKSGRAGTSNFQLLRFSSEREDLNELNEEDEDVPTQEDADDDNETVVADSSPVRGLDSPARNFKIDLSLAKANILPGPASAPIFNPRLIHQMTTKQEAANGFPLNQSFSSADIPTFNQQSFQMKPENKSFGYSMSTPDVVSPFNNHFDGQRSVSFSGTPMSMVTSTPAKDQLNFGLQGQQIPGQQAQGQLQGQQVQVQGQVQNQMLQVPQGQMSQIQMSQAQMSLQGQMQNLQNMQQGQQIQQGQQGQQGQGMSLQTQVQNKFNAAQAQNSFQSYPNIATPSGQKATVQQGQPGQQLMVNLGNGFVPFGSLPPDLQEKYTPMQQQFQFQQQQLMLLQQQQDQRNRYQQPLQNLPLNTMNPLSAPAYQTTFNETKPKKKSSATQNTIKFAPMLEYDPSKDSATAAAAAAAAASASAKANARRVKRPGVSVLNIPRETPVYIYKPPKRKSDSSDN